MSAVTQVLPTGQVIVTIREEVREEPECGPLCWSILSVATPAWGQALAGYLRASGPVGTSVREWAKPVQEAITFLQQPQPLVPARNRAALELLQQWLADDSGYDERVWPALKDAIEEHRLSDRRPFCD